MPETKNHRRHRLNFSHHMQASHPENFPIYKTLRAVSAGFEILCSRFLTSPFNAGALLL